MVKSQQNKCKNKEITFDVIILLGVNDTWVQPEETTVLNTPEHTLKHTIKSNGHTKMDIKVYSSLEGLALSVISCFA